MRNMMLRALVYLLLCAAPAYGADSVNASPKFGRAPQDVRITVKVDNDEANRAVRIEADGTAYRSSAWEIDGSSRRTTEVWFKSLPAGRYTITLTVLKADGRQVVKTDRICILGGLRDGNEGCEQGSDGPDSLSGLAED